MSKRKTSEEMEVEKGISDFYKYNILYLRIINNKMVKKYIIGLKKYSRNKKQSAMKKRILMLKIFSLFLVNINTLILALCGKLIDTVN